MTEDDDSARRAEMTLPSLSQVANDLDGSHSHAEMSSHVPVPVTVSSLPVPVQLPSFGNLLRACDYDGVGGQEQQQQAVVLVYQPHEYAAAYPPPGYDWQHAYYAPPPPHPPPPPLPQQQHQQQQSPTSIALAVEYPHAAPPYPSDYPIPPDYHSDIHHADIHHHESEDMLFPNQLLRDTLLADSSNTNIAADSVDADKQRRRGRPPRRIESLPRPHPVSLGLRFNAVSSEVIVVCVKSPTVVSLPDSVVDTKMEDTSQSDNNPVTPNHVSPTLSDDKYQWLPDMYTSNLFMIVEFIVNFGDFIRQSGSNCSYAADIFRQQYDGQPEVGTPHGISSSVENWELEEILFCMMDERASVLFNQLLIFLLAPLIWVQFEASSLSGMFQEKEDRIFFLLHANVAFHTDTVIYILSLYLDEFSARFTANIDISISTFLKCLRGEEPDAMLAARFIVVEFLINQWHETGDFQREIERRLSIMPDLKRQERKENSETRTLKKLLAGVRRELREVRAKSALLESAYRSKQEEETKPPEEREVRIDSQRSSRSVTVSEMNQEEKEAASEQSPVEIKSDLTLAELKDQMVHCDKKIRVLEGEERNLIRKIENYGDSVDNGDVEEGTVVNEITLSNRVQDEVLWRSISTRNQPLGYDRFRREVWVFKSFHGVFFYGPEVGDDEQVKETEARWYFLSMRDEVNHLFRTIDGHGMAYEDERRLKKVLDKWQRILQTKEQQAGLEPNFCRRQKLDFSIKEYLEPIPFATRCEKLVDLLTKLCESSNFSVIDEVPMPTTVPELYEWLTSTGIQHQKTVKKRNKKTTTSNVASSLNELLCATCCSKQSEVADLRKGLNRWFKVFESSAEPESNFLIDLLLQFCHQHLPSNKDEPSIDTNEDAKTDNLDHLETQSGPLDAGEISDTESVLSSHTASPPKQKGKRALEESNPVKLEERSRKTRRK